MPASPPPRYPISVSLTNQPVLVVGGGPVAARKVRRLVRSRARVTLVAPLVTDELATLADAGALRWHPRPYRAGDVAGQALVFTATGQPDTDRAVVAAARAVGTLVNCADQAIGGDFDLPALLERGPLQVTVSTAGAAPGLAARLVRELARHVPEALGDYVGLLDEVRQALRERHPGDPAARQRAFAAALDCVEARAAAEAGERERARTLISHAAGLDGPG
jgi:siroheme synthase-like protein